MRFVYALVMFFGSVVLYLSSAELRRAPVGFEWSSLIGFAAFFLLTVASIRLFASKLSPWMIFVAIFLGLALLELPFRILDFRSTLISFPDAMSRLVGIVSGFAFMQLKSPANKVVAGLGSVLVIFVFFQGYTLWIHKLNYGTFTGSISETQLEFPVEARDESGRIVGMGDLQNRTVLLDFWHTRCGACYEKFPQLQVIYEKYKADGSTLIVALNKPLDEDREKSAFQVISDIGYSFPVLIAQDSELPEKLGVGVYPTTLVIDRNGNVVYKGDISGAVLKFEKLVETSQ